MSLIQGPIERAVLRGANQQSGSAPAVATVMADGVVSPAEVREARAVMQGVWQQNGKLYDGHESAAQLDQYKSVLEGELCGSCSPERRAEIAAIMPKLDYARALTHLAEDVDSWVQGAAADQSALTRAALAVLDKF